MQMNLLLMTQLKFPTFSKTIFKDWSLNISFACYLAQRLPARKPKEESPERRLVKSKQCEKVVFPRQSNLRPLGYWSTALPLEQEKTSPLKLNFA